MSGKKFGIIEGFYGNPWGHEERMEMLSFMAQIGLNTYIYGPKNEKKHRNEWRIPYTEREMNNFKQLIQRAEKKNIKFYYTLGSGVDMVYSGEEDFKSIMDKFIKLYEIGCRGFGLLLDDISSKFKYDQDNDYFTDFASAHAYISNKVYAALKDMGEDIDFILCPTDYYTDRFSDYMPKVGELLDQNIDIFWTGHEVCSEDITTEEAKAVEKVFDRKPLVWDNYPVNDLAMHRRMHIGAYTRRDHDLPEATAGIVLNVMAKPEASKISMITFADYITQGSQYNPVASWDKALRILGGEKDIESLKIFGENSLLSCLYEQGAPTLRFKVKAYIDGKEGALEELKEYLEDLKATSNYLLHHMENKKLLSEIEPWIEALGEYADSAFMILEGDKEAGKAFIESEKERLLITDHEIDRLAENILQ